ncbi:hypothetical protein [Lysinibacillus sp. 54212]|uniref:hypothetical protein n=1 Tax=Lysinibacillus sp. 54212 TaxID=3119829 RepID=UPI002FC686BA
MANTNRIPKDTLPDGYDPYDMNLKKRINYDADDLNYVSERARNLVLCCGAKKRKKEGVCKQLAGFGTKHVGWGRCKFCGGANTGPKTAEAKKRTSQNARKHGFYSSVLSEEERATYEELIEGKDVGLDQEIYMMKAKIKVYLAKYYRKRKAGEAATVEWFKDGEEKGYFHAGTIEDRTLTRALETLRRLVDSHAKLTGQNTDTLLDQINAELRQASQAASQDSWGGNAQNRQNNV